MLDESHNLFVGIIVDSGCLFVFLATKWALKRLSLLDCHDSPIFVTRLTEWDVLASVNEHTFWLILTRDAKNVVEKLVSSLGFIFKFEILLFGSLYRANVRVTSFRI
jgi:hypothetical protein